MEFKAPEWFYQGMPETALDGELWAGRGTLNHLRENCLKAGGDWSSVVFRPFDVPEQSLKIENAIVRISALTLPAHVQSIRQRRIASTEEAIAAMRCLASKGGEGVMLRKPGSGYNGMHCCRSEKLLKLKPSMLHS